MDIKYYLTILWGNKWIIVTTLMVTLIVVTFGTLLITPIYSATATLRVATASTGSLSSADYAYAERLMNTYTKIASSGPVLQELANKLNLQTIPEVKVSTISSTELIQILVKSSDPIIAQNAANTLAEILIEQSQKLYAGGVKSTTEILAEQLSMAESDLNQARADYEDLVAKSPEDTEAISKASMIADLKEKTYETLLDQYEAARVKEAIRANTITLIDPAVFPMKPSQPQLLMNITLGVIIGLVLGVGLVFLIENLNPRLYTLDQIEAVTELDVIEKIPSVKTKGFAGLFKKKVPLNRPAFKSSFQKLQTKIAQINSSDQPMKSLLFTSAVPGEGKSTIIANLAIAIGRAGQNVIIVDCDMRLPTQHKIFNLPNTQGLSTLLIHQSRLMDVIKKNRNPNTWILTSGPVVHNPMELLASAQMKSVLEQLTKNFDYVLLDTPALLPVGDAMALATIVDGIILITRQFYCKEDDLRETHKALADLNTRIIGVVVNDVKHSRSYNYTKYKYS